MTQLPDEPTPPSTTTSAPQPESAHIPSLPEADIPSSAASTAVDVPETSTDDGPKITHERTFNDADLQALSDHDIFRLTQELKDSEANHRPLIAPVTPLLALQLEYEESPIIVKKIDWLVKHWHYNGIRRTRGDGDCFYRSLAFAYIEQILTSPDPSLAVATSLSHLDSTLPLLEQAGFQPIVYEDFYESLTSLINEVVTPGASGKTLTKQTLLEAFQHAETSNSIVVFLRLLTSAFIRLSPEDDFLPFLFHPETGEMQTVQQFCETFVEAFGREADHPQMLALSKALRVRIKVAYLDQSASPSAIKPDGSMRVDFVDFEPEGAEEDGTKPVVLLYRPGHYDTLEENAEE